MDTPVPGGLVIAQGLHGVARDLLTGHRGCGFQLPFLGGLGGLVRRLGGGDGGNLLGLGSQHRDIGAVLRDGRKLLGVGFQKGCLLGLVGVAVVYIAGDPDGDRAQDQGYVIALSGCRTAIVFVIAHIIEAPPKLSIDAFFRS